MKNAVVKTIIMLVIMGLLSSLTVLSTSLEGKANSFSVGSEVVKASDKIECNVCDGTGDCQTCNGDKKLEDGSKCYMCDGSGDCWFCDGEGNY